MVGVGLGVEIMLIQNNVISLKGDLGCFSSIAPLDPASEFNQNILMKVIDLYRSFRGSQKINQVRLRSVSTTKTRSIPPLLVRESYNLALCIDDEARSERA